MTTRRKIANKVLLELEGGEEFYFRSTSDPRRQYTTRIHADGRVACDCPAWRFKKAGNPRHCQHVERLAQALGPRRRLTYDNDYCYLRKDHEPN